MLRAFSLLCAAAIPLFATPAAAVEEQDFIDFAGAHCRALISEGRADMAFALGKASAKFSQQDMLDFNKAFAAKLIKQYHIDPAKGCVLDVLSMKPIRNESSKPPSRGRYAQPEIDREIAVVAGVMGTVDSQAPVSVAYRLERIGSSPWVITNITLDGQPLVARYREAYEAHAKKGGAEAVMKHL
jgi:ABC-type transporter MlaC component